MIPARHLQPKPKRCVLTMHEVQSIKDLVFIVGRNSESAAQKAIFEILADGIRKAIAYHSPSTPAPAPDEPQLCIHGNVCKHTIDPVWGGHSCCRDTTCEEYIPRPYTPAMDEITERQKERQKEK